MQYVGGKSQIAKALARVMCPARARMVWDPFCGGLSVSYALAQAGARAMCCSDACAPLIALYQQVRSGWIPPNEVSEDEYRRAKELPDQDPLKAFCGFGLSFGGKWFGGYARGSQTNYAHSARNVLAKHVSAIPCEFVHASFLDQVPCVKSANGLLIYADPPYHGTQSYGAVGAFNHGRFWDLCRRWAGLGAEVWVSEYQAPSFATQVWSKTHALKLAGGSQSAVRVERLFRVLR